MTEPWTIDEAADLLARIREQLRELEAPKPFPRRWSTRDELGYPLLNDPCPICHALALIVNEWDAAKCLTCSWREFEPNSPRATYIDWEASR